MSALIIFLEFGVFALLFYPIALLLEPKIKKLLPEGEE
jgi:hypothetical protein